ncbi:hypothetical protein [Prevotella pallens]|uniref:hypothetical protein n=1 Tax=Prevotella pallens TaxID=60133 RepID=UPI001CAB5B5F|nr:hypothetical protein [Prevotella pallens]MBF1458474.1 hypothetical protein [Prevotella pallens]
MNNEKTTHLLPMGTTKEYTSCKMFVGATIRRYIYTITRRKFVNDDICHENI